MADIDPGSLNISADTVSSVISPRTRMNNPVKKQKEVHLNLGENCP